MLPGYSKPDEERQVSRCSSNATGVAWRARLMTVSVAAADARVPTMQYIRNEIPSPANGYQISSWAACMCNIHVYTRRGGWIKS